MRILIAPQAFKGSMSARDAARAIAEGVRRALPGATLDLLPVADGGDGTLDALVEASRGEYREATATGPLGDSVRARWGVLGDGRTALIEMARVSGLALVPRDRLDPLRATTHGLGEVVRAALETGLRQLLIGIGGSATNDAGAGMMQALGVRFLDSRGRELPRGGLALRDLDRIDASGLLPGTRQARFRVLCDVANPLLGPRGASAVYGPQKGATPEMVRDLDGALARWAEVVKRDLGADVADIPGAGAAGGLGAGLLAFLKAELRPGIDLVCEALRFDERLEGVDLVFTGEGRVDASSAFNKAPVGVARRAAARGVPTVCFAGSLGPGYEAVYGFGIAAVVPILDGPTSLDEAMRSGPRLLADAAERTMRVLGLSRGRVGDY